MPISLSGVISGIDSQSIVDQIIAARARPIIQLEDRIAGEESRKTALSDLRGRMSTLLTRAQSLTNLATLNARTGIASTAATSGDAVVSVAVDSTAAIKTFTVSVEQLATATQTESTGPIGQAIDATAALDQAGLSGLETTVTTGTFTIKGTTTATISVAAGDSLNAVMGKINAETVNTGITATLVGNTLQLDSAGGRTSSWGRAGTRATFSRRRTCWRRQGRRRARARGRWGRCSRTRTWTAPGWRRRWRRRRDPFRSMGWRSRTTRRMSR